MARGTFPQSYESVVKPDPNLCKMVDFDKTGYGSNPAGLPRTEKPGDLTIEHVGGSKGGR